MPLTLADVVSRGTPVEWFEGVAVTQALCDALVHDTSARVVPELNQIEITADGTVALIGRPSGGSPPIQGAGRVLLALVPEHQMPVQLRLLGLTAVSPTPSYASVFELSSALDYFARPDRAAQVRAVYEKCAALPTGDAAGAARVDPPPLPAGPERARVARPKRRLVPLAVAALIVAIAAGAGGWWAYVQGYAGSNGSGTALVQAVTGTAQKASQLAADAALTVGRQLGLAQEAVVEPPPADAAEPEEKSPPSRGGRSRRAAVEDPLPLVAAWAPLTPEPPLVDETVIVPTSDRADTTGVPGDEPEAGYYTEADAGVEPPALVRPRLPQLPPSGIRFAELPHVDLLISETGEVEWVKLWPASVSVHSAMMLSAIKNWRFEPARRNGHAVKYRQTITLTTQ